MKSKIKILAILACLAAFGGCDTEKGGNPGDNPAPITLWAQPQAELSGGTRAAEGFPNSGRIGVLAAYSDSYSQGGADWQSYPDIYNAPATATSVSAGIYSFTWDEQKYWPYDDRELLFMAYSPLADGENLILSEPLPVLLLKLHKDMQDVMYAAGTGGSIAGPYKKSDKSVVDLGEFRHLLSQLTVKVVADPMMEESIQITGLEVSTTHETAVFDLRQGDDGLSFGSADNEYFAYTLISDNTPFKNNTFSRTVLLYPSTEEVTQVTISLFDSNHPTSTITRSYMMTAFQNESQNGKPLELQRGVNTTLEIKVKSINVITPEITLQGQISDWTYGEDFGVTIN